jgi:dCMP deaminase
MFKRKDYISWDDYFMGIATLSGMRSKDPNSQVGACIVNLENQIMGTGYNGFPRGCSDDKFPWKRSGNFLETKYPYVVHAEQNAIINSTGNLKDCKIYVGLHPCNECVKPIIQSGINEIIYTSNKYSHTQSIIAAKKMLKAVGLKTRQFIPKNDKLLIDFLKIRH